MRTFLIKNVKALQKYNINIFGLENKQYVYELGGDNAFFEALEQSLIEKGRFKAVVSLDKSATMLQMKFDITGVVELTCDRSLDVFDESFSVSKRMIFKFGDHSEELTDEIELINWDTATINVAHHIFDFIGLAIPIKKLHPRFRQEEEDDEAEGIMVYRSTDEAEEETENQPEEEKIDPRWEALKKLKGGF